MRILRRIAVASVLLVALLCLPTFLSSLPTARGSSGGPDSYGYTWTDSKPVPGVSYGWVDGLSGGTDLLLARKSLGIIQTKRANRSVNRHWVLPPCNADDNDE